MPGARGDQDRVAGSNPTLFPVDFNRALSVQQKIEFLRLLVVVPIG